jgi:hypothetical protein
MSLDKTVEARNLSGYRLSCQNFLGIILTTND